MALRSENVKCENVLLALMQSVDIWERHEHIHLVSTQRARVLKYSGRARVFVIALSATALVFSEVV